MTLTYNLMRFWRRKSKASPADRHPGFRARIGLTRLNDTDSLSLVLENKSQKDVWAEEIELFLSGLTAEEQMNEPRLHELQKIRQLVPREDTLVISLGQAIYNAAGTPQRNYSCVLSPILRVRAGKEWLENRMESYKVRMLGLTAREVRRARRELPLDLPPDRTEDVPSLATRLK